MALLNRGRAASDIAVNWTQIGLDSGPAAVRDLWARSDLGGISNRYAANAPSHGVVLLRVAGKAAGRR
jgi:alpha-galactosidase